MSTVEQAGISETSTPLERWKRLPAKDHLEAAEAFLVRYQASDQWQRKYLAGTLPDRSVPPGDPQVVRGEGLQIRTRLQLIHADQPEHARAQDLLQQLDELQKRADATQAALMAKIKAQLRKAYAKTLQDNLLDQRIDAQVSASGKDNTILTIMTVLASNVTARDLEKSGLVDRALDQGFLKVRYTDGRRQVWEFEPKTPR